MNNSSERDAQLFSFSSRCISANKIVLWMPTIIMWKPRESQKGKEKSKTKREVGERERKKTIEKNI